MDSVYRRRVGGREGVGKGGGGWEAEGGLNHLWAQGQSHCVFSKTQKQPQYKDKTVTGSNLTPHAALLVHPSGTIWTVMNLHGQKNVACESRPDYLQPCHWCVLIVLECYARSSPLSQCF